MQPNPIVQINMRKWVGHLASLKKHLQDLRQWLITEIYWKIMTWTSSELYQMQIKYAYHLRYRLCHLSYSSCWWVMHAFLYINRSIQLLLECASDLFYFPFRALWRLFLLHSVSLNDFCVYFCCPEEVDIDAPNSLPSS